VARLVGRRSADDEFIRCTGPVDLATRLGTGRPFSAVLVDHRTVGLDRELVRRASAAGCPVIVVGGTDDPGRLVSLGAAAHMEEPPSVLDLDAMLTGHATPIGRIDDLRLGLRPTASGDGRDDGQNAAGSDRTIRARVRSAPTGPSQLAAAGFMATGLLILAAATIAFFLSRGTGEPPPEPPPLVMEGGPVVTYLGTSYQIGRPGDVSVVRSCDGQGTAWLLRPSTGAIYSFEAWATDEMVIADPIRIVLGGQSLRLAHSLGCTDVHVETTDGRSVPLTDGS
jgi:hypothetical protein